MQRLWNFNMFSDADSEGTTDTLMTFHPFNNTCKFPIPKIYAEDIMVRVRKRFSRIWSFQDYRLSERMRNLKCEVLSKDYASMDTEGFIYVHPHFVDYPRIEHDVKCKVDIIEGGLRQPKINMTKNMFRVVKTLDVSLCLWPANGQLSNVTGTTHREVLRECQRIHHQVFQHFEKCREARCSNLVQTVPRNERFEPS